MEKSKNLPSVTNKLDALYKHKKNNVTSSSVPAALLNGIAPEKISTVLRKYILTSKEERKSLSVGERNFLVENAKYNVLGIPEEEKKENCKNQSIRISPVEIRTLKILTGQSKLKDAVIVALCAMVRLKESKLASSNATQEKKPIKPAAPEMGSKKWFLNMHKTIIAHIKLNFPACNTHIEPFMGSGIIGENAAFWDEFDKVIGNDLNEEKISYFITIRKYAPLFKSIITCLDYATSPEYEIDKGMIVQNIMASLKQFDKKGDYWVHNEVLSALEYFLLKNKIMKIREVTKKTSITSEIAEQPEKESISFLRHPIQWIKQKLGKDVTEMVVESAPELEITEEEQPLSAEDRICAMISWVSEWKQKKAFKTIKMHTTKLPALQRIVDDIGREADALGKIEILNQDAMKIIKKYAGNPKVVLVCDPPYWDCLGYGTSFTFEHHKEMAKLLAKHAKSGVFLYFGRPTAPRSLNTAAEIDYSQRDKIYMGKFNELFSGKGFFYKDYDYDKAHGVIERVVSNMALKDFSLYGK